MGKTKADLESELAELRAQIDEQDAPDADTGNGAAADAARARDEGYQHGYRDGRAQAADEAARILYEACGKQTPTVRRIRALGETDPER